MRLSQKNRLFVSAIVTLVILVTSLLTGKNPQSLIQQSTKPSTSVQGIQTSKNEAKVVKVVDGDTLTVEQNGKKEKVRIIGINTPESVDPRRAVQCFGKQASLHAKEVLSGQIVQLESDQTQSERDKYGRLLRHVWMQNGTVNFGKLQIEGGYAHEYTYDVSYKYQAEYKEAEKRAQEEKKGLWAESACALESGK